MRILSAREYNGSLKVTIQQTGRMNFSEETAKVLSLTTDMGVKFFTDGEPEQLYMAIMSEPDNDSFQIRKSGTYYYVPANALFDNLGIDYKAYTVIYNLVRCPAYDGESGGQCYKMNCKPIKKKTNEEGDVE